jgi:hypothetical protein
VHKLAFLALPSILIVGAAALSIPGPHLIILSVAISLASIWMVAHIKVRKLSGVEFLFGGLVGINRLV